MNQKGRVRPRATLGRLPYPIAAFSGLPGSATRLSPPRTGTGPFTSNLYAGAGVPMPTLPLAFILMRANAHNPNKTNLTTDTEAQRVFSSRVLFRPIVACILRRALRPTQNARNTLCGDGRRSRRRDGSRSVPPCLGGESPLVFPPRRVRFGRKHFIVFNSGSQR